MGFLVAGAAYADYGTKRQFYHFSRARAAAPLHPRSRAGTTRLRTPTPSNTISLESLPLDILFQIYAHAGVGDTNHLHLASRRFHDLFSRPRPWWLETLVRAHFAMRIDAGKWARRLARRAALLPEGDVRARAAALVEAVDRTPMAIDARFFRLRLVTRDIVAHVARQFPAIVLEDPVVAREQVQRRRYLQYRCAVLEHYASNATDTASTADGPTATTTATATATTIVISETHPSSDVGSEAPDALARAETACAALAAKLGVTHYAPALASSPVPLDMYRRVTARTLGVVLLLHQHFGMAVTVALLVVAAVDLALRSPADVGAVAEAVVYVRDHMDPPEAVAALGALARARDALFAQPLLVRGALPLAQVVESLTALAESALRRLYAVGGDDTQVWPMLHQLEMSELTDVAIDLGGTPAF